MRILGINLFWFRTFRYPCTSLVFQGRFGFGLVFKDLVLFGVFHDKVSFFIGQWFQLAFIFIGYSIVAFTQKKDARPFAKGLDIR